MNAADLRNAIKELVTQDGLVTTSVWESVNKVLLIDTWSLVDGGRVLSLRGNVEWQQLAQGPIIVGYGQQLGGLAQRLQRAADSPVRIP